jgi:hypothetical protein
MLSHQQILHFAMNVTTTTFYGDMTVTFITNECRALGGLGESSPFLVAGLLVRAGARVPLVAPRSRPPSPADADCQVRLSQRWTTLRIVKGYPQNAISASFPSLRRTSLESWKPHSHPAVPLPAPVVSLAHLPARFLRPARLSRRAKGCRLPERRKLP